MIDKNESQFVEEAIPLLTFDPIKKSNFLI